jgi:hypothetical protein
MHIPPAEGNFKEGGKAVKPLINDEYTTHMGYVQLSDMMGNSYNIRKKSCKWTKKIFHLLDLIILNSCSLYKSFRGNLTHLIFRKHLVRDLFSLSHEENTEILGMPCGRPRSFETPRGRLEVKQSLNLRDKGKDRRHVYHMNKLRKK